MVHGDKATLIDARLFLPERWTSDEERCEKAGVPVEERSFRTKHEIALEIVQNALDSGVRFAYVAFDVIASGAQSNIKARVFFTNFPNRVLYVSEMLPDTGWHDVFLADDTQPDQTTVYVARRGRLAIDRRYHNRGLGQALMRDAMLRAVHVASDTGVFAVLVHALSDAAKQFYLSRGFVESPLQPMTLIMTLATIRTILSEPN